MVVDMRLISVMSMQLKGISQCAIINDNSSVSGLYWV
jgi:hypothetical protein